MTIYNLMENISKQAQRLEWAMKLPPREGLCLIDGIDELRGADYDEGFLKQSVGEAMANYDESTISGDYPLGGSVEKFEIEKEKEMAMENIRNQEQKWGEERRSDEI